MLGEFIDRVRKAAQQEDFYNAEAMWSRSREEGFSYRKKENLFRSGHWRGESVPALREDSNFLTTRVVITGHSDYPFTLRDAAVARVHGSRAVFAQNVSFDLVLAKKMGVEALPIGPQTKDAIDSELVWAARNMPREDQRQSLIYSNFNPNTSPGKRQQLHSLLPSLSRIVYRGVYSTSSQGRLNFLEELARFRYFLAPEGNGLDSHRIWEGLCVGSVPVVKAKTYSHRLLQELNLPVIGISRWEVLEQVDVARDFDTVLRRKRFSSRALRLSCWINRLERMRK